MFGETVRFYHWRPADSSGYIGMGCNPKWSEGFSGRRIALCEEEMEVQFGAQGS
jgi:hypothetical protein